MLSCSKVRTLITPILHYFAFNLAVLPKQFQT